MNPSRSIPVIRLIIAGLVAIQVYRSAGASAPGPAELDPIIAAASKYEPGSSLQPLRQIEDWVAQAAAAPGKSPQLEQGLVRLLGPGSTFEARRFAAKQLGIIGTDASVPALAKLLGSQETVGIACLALTTYSRGKADEALRSALASETSLVRIQIINTIGDRRDPKAVRDLARIASDHDLGAAEAAVAALGKVGNREAWKAISALGKKATPGLHSAIVEAEFRCADTTAASGDRKLAGRIYTELLAPSEPAYVRRSALDSLLRWDQDHGATRIQEILHGGDFVLKPVAIAAVASLPSPDASERFGKELPKLSPVEQVWMIDSLAFRGDAPAQSAIGQALGSPDASVRQAAVAALGRIGDGASVHLLAASAMNAAGAEEGRAVETALISLKGGGATDRKILEELDKSALNARGHLIAALARRQGPAANPVLIREAASPNPQVAVAAFRALATTAGENELRAVLASVGQTGDAEVRSAAESAARQGLVRVEAAHKSGLVCDALDKASKPEGRSDLVALLPVCADAQALERLRAETKNTNLTVREAAVRALSEWPDVAAWPNLFSLYRQPENELCRGLALRGLVRMASDENLQGDPAVIDRYMQLLAGAKGDSDLKLILGGIAGAKQSAALQLAIPLLTNAGVRAEAEVAVKRIAASIQAQNPQAAKEALQQIGAK